MKTFNQICKMSSPQNQKKEANQKTMRTLTTTIINQWWTKMIRMRLKKGRKKKT